MVAPIGSCVEIPCTYFPIRESEKSSIVWYLHDRLYYIEIFNSRTSSSVRNDYRRRTSLVPGGSCTLRIDPVRREDEGHYYPGVAGSNSKNAYSMYNRTIYLAVTDSPAKPVLRGSGDMTEGIATIIRCYADHTCASNPPSLEWNKPGPTNRQSVTLSGGNWREVSELTYIPTYVDDGAIVQCTATYPNGLRIQNEAVLIIKFPPKGVTVTSVLTPGGDAHLSCGSRNSKPAVSKYEWYRGKNKAKLQVRQQILIVKNVTWDMEPYSCTAINDVGSGESALTEIPVQYAPIKVHIIQSEPKDGVTELKCDFLSSRPNVTHYSWMKNNSLLPNETGQILLVIKTEKNNGIYSCIAHNRAGSSPSEEVYIEGKAEEQTNIVVYLAISGIICLLLFLLIIYFCWRKNKCQQSPSNETTELQEATYTDLVKSGMSAPYDTLKPVITVTGRIRATIPEYENVNV
ncbi:B-cell receptor CD22-like [Pseudophryne corroboree]|uniref:B-cell receptor CD22-like n=1 Tax=Pseudophryne corroboree TaxID=495146 RepID=UPI00308148A5